MRVDGGEGAWPHVAAADRVGAAARVGGCAQGKKTPLHVAIKEGHLEVAMALIDKGANVNAEDKVSASVGCMCACVRACVGAPSPQGA